MRRVERVCISVPSDLLAEFDEAVEKMGYPNRSKAVQEAMRLLLADWKASESLVGEISGAIVMIYDHSKPGLVQELLDIQHEHEDIIAATMHVHLTERDCLEVITVRGDASKVRELAEALKTRKGVKALKVVVL